MTYVRAQWDRAAAVVLAVAGVVALVLGWVGASGTTDPAEQIPFVLSGGLVGVAAIVGAAALWLSADLRDEWRKLDRLEAALRSEGVA